MKQYFAALSFLVLLSSMVFISFACGRFPIGPGSSTVTPTTTVGSTASTTPVRTIVSGTATSTPGCASYNDNFSSATLSNYDYYMNSTQVATTASGADYQITGGILEVAPTVASNNGGLAIVKDTLFSHSLSNYTAEADFELDSYQSGEGLFGIAFHTGSNGSFYCFQWNGNFSNADGGTKDWEIEKNTGTPSVSFTYPAAGNASYGYTLGTWVHLKVVVAGNNFQCYVNHNDGTGDHLIYNATDSSSPYLTGGAGVRTYGVNSPNVARIDNLFVNAQSCGGTSTPTFTYTPTNTATPTLTYTSTPTFTFTPTATSSCVVFTDNYPDASSLANYSYFLNSSQTASTATGCDYAVIPGFLQVAPVTLAGNNNGGLAVVNNSLFSYSLTHYTLTASFEMDNTTDGEGLFGIAFRTGSNGSFYCFQWNGNGVNQWQIEENTGSPSVNFSYPGASTSTHPYVLGTTCTLQVVATGSNFLCYANLNDGTGNHLIYNVNDSTYSSGGVGIRTYGVHEGNKINISSFSADTCP